MFNHIHQIYSKHIVENIIDSISNLHRKIAWTIFTLALSKKGFFFMQLITISQVVYSNKRKICTRRSQLFSKHQANACQQFLVSVINNFFLFNYAIAHNTIKAEIVSKLSCGHALIINNNIVVLSYSAILCWLSFIWQKHIFPPLT